MATENKSEAEYVLAKPTVVQGTAVPQGGETTASATVVKTGKQGHKCCGGCCDVRRGVIIVNIVHMCFSAFGIMILCTYMGLSNKVDEFDDDEVKEALNNFDDSAATVGVAIGLLLLKFICNGLGIYGAVSYNIWMVGISLISYCIDFVMATLSLAIGGMLVAGFFAYPHFFFIKEVRAGTMTKENYPVNEAQSCCCV